MSSLRVISLTVLADSIYNILTFFAEKKLSSFHIFFSQKFQHICVSLDLNFNESLTNDVVSFEQLGPEIFCIGRQLPKTGNCLPDTFTSVWAGLSGSIGCVFDWCSGGCGFDPCQVGNSLPWRLIMKYFLRSFSPFCWFKKGSCQFLAKKCAVQYWLTGKRSLHCPVKVWLGKLTTLDMTPVCWMGHKTSTQTNSTSRGIFLKDQIFWDKFFLLRAAPMRRDKIFPCQELFPLTGFYAAAYLCIVSSLEKCEVLICSRRHLRSYLKWE